MTVLTPELVAALLARGERANVLVARTLLLERTLLRVETRRLPQHQSQNITVLATVQRRRGIRLDEEDTREVGDILAAGSESAIENRAGLRRLRPVPSTHVVAIVAPS